MPEVQYQQLPEAERREALQGAALLCGRRKRIWVVTALVVGADLEAHGLRLPLSRNAGYPTACSPSRTRGES